MVGWSVLISLILLYVLASLNHQLRVQFFRLDQI
jgi:hypothetical protein